MKLRLIVLISFVSIMLSPITALAQGTEPPIPPAPVNGNYVVDNLNWLNNDQEGTINAIVQKLDSDGLAEIAVVTLNDCGEDKQKYRYELFNTWGVGHAGKDDGLLILVCWFGGDKSLRSVEQETGKGMEEIIPDLMTSKVVKQYFVPAFATGDPDEEVIRLGKAGDGLVAMVAAYDKVIRGQTPAELQQAVQPATGLFLGLTPTDWIVIGFIILLLALVLLGGASGSSSSTTFSSSNSSSDDSNDTPSFGGGNSGGGGSSTGF